MLIPRQIVSEANGRHGGRTVSLAELRRHLSDPTPLCDRDRQRLLELARRLRRVRALGDEYARVELSPDAQAAMNLAQAAG